MGRRGNRVSGSKTKSSPTPGFHSSSFQFPISPRKDRLMVILKGKRNGACIIHSLIFPLITREGAGRRKKKCGWKDVILRGAERDDVEQNLDTVERFDEAGKENPSLSLSCGELNK